LKGTPTCKGRQTEKKRGKKNLVTTKKGDSPPMRGKLDTVKEEKKKK